MNVRREDGTELRLIPRLGYKPLIGMIHLPRLTERSTAGFSERIIEYALWEAGKLVDAGFQGVLVENYNDAPYSITVKDKYITHLITIVVRELVKEYGNKVSIGVNILRNSGVEAAVIAAVSGAHFIRVNAYCDVRLSMEGILYPIAAEIEDVRRRLPRHVMVFADVDVKHSLRLGDYKLEEVVRDCVVRGSVSAIIVSSSATGEAPSPGYVAAIRKYSTPKPILVGSGITVENIKAYWSIADGFIVGTSIKIDGKTTNPIDFQRAKKLAEQAEELRNRDMERIGLKG
jgi:membrane complex biogenesis BtpA family protein